MYGRYIWPSACASVNELLSFTASVCEVKGDERMKRTRKSAAQAGVTLIETLIATGLMVTVATGLMALAGVALQTTENQGHLMARTAEYSQDKMEQLLALAYGDSSSNSATVPTSATGGTGLAVGGGANPASPVTGYVDYLDSTGNILTGNPPANWFYIRVWSISAYGGSGNIKQITVTTQVSSQVGEAGALPRSTLGMLKVNPF